MCTAQSPQCKKQLEAEVADPSLKNKGNGWWYVAGVVVAVGAVATYQYMKNRK